MNLKEYRYSQEHEWICLESANKWKIGLTDYAQSRLGDMVYIDLLSPGNEVGQRQKLGEVESAKAVSEIFTPVSGQVLEINQAVINESGLVNQDPYGKGWLVKLELSNLAELDTLMDKDKYDELVARLSEE